MHTLLSSIQHNFNFILFFLSHINYYHCVCILVSLILPQHPLSSIVVFQFISQVAHIHTLLLSVAPSTLFFVLYSYSSFLQHYHLYKLCIKKGEKDHPIIIFWIIFYNRHKLLFSFTDISISNWERIFPVLISIYIYIYIKNFFHKKI